MNRLEGIHLTADGHTHRAPTYVARRDGTWDWDDCVDIRKSDIDLLLGMARAVAEIGEDGFDAIRELVGSVMRLTAQDSFMSSLYNLSGAAAELKEVT